MLRIRSPTTQSNLYSESEIHIKYPSLKFNGKLFLIKQVAKDCDLNTNIQSSLQID